MSADLLQQWFPRYDADLQRIHAFWRGQGRALVSLYPSSVAYRQVFDDDRVLKAVPTQLKAMGQLPGVSLPTFWPDYGTVTTAKYWGCTPRFDSTGGNIFVDPLVRRIDETEGLKPKAIDDPDQDAAHAIRMFKHLQEQFNTDRLWLRSPDMQGPLNTAVQVMQQEELFMAMYEEPEKVHAFLERVTRFLIDYARYLRAGSDNRVLGNIWPYSLFPAEYGVSFTEDIMPLISADAYAEFALPCLHRLADAFGGIHIHCCGQYGRHVQALVEAKLPIRAMEFHHPFTRVEQLLPLAERGTVLIPYLNAEHNKGEYADTFAFYRHLLQTTGDRVRFWFAIPDDSADARAFAAELT